MAWGRHSDLAGGSECVFVAFSLQEGTAGKRLIIYSIPWVEGE